MTSGSAEGIGCDLRRAVIGHALNPEDQELALEMLHPFKHVTPKLYAGCPKPSDQEGRFVDSKVKGERT
jgi:hypothetical protein